MINNYILVKNNYIFHDDFSIITETVFLQLSDHAAMVSSGYSRFLHQQKSCRGQIRNW